MRRKSITLLLIGSLVLSLAGCGSGQAESVPGSSEQIELIDPVNAEVTFEEVARRNLYDTAIYGATVVPYVEEYCADYSFQFGSYGAYYGEKVGKGKEILLANTENIDEQIKAKKEYIISMQEDYEEYVEKQTKALEEQRTLEARFQREVQKNEALRPEEFIEDENGELIKNPEYDAWEYGYEFNEGCYRIAKNDGDIIQQDMDKKKTLYEMDLKHEKYLLGTLQKTRSNATVEAKMAGEIVSLKEYEPGDYVQAENMVVAVGDMSQKLLRCDYVNKNTIKNAKEIYAWIDGVKYDVEYHPISSDEYARLSANGGKVYSTFSLLNYGEEVQIGDYAVITIVSKEFDDVISVPKEAIKKDDAGSYVYVYQDGKNVYTQIQTGFSDGIYTEVTSGLQVGDKVLYSSAKKVSAEKTQKLTKGDFYTEFNNKAELKYPSRYAQYNTIQNGTAYFVEYQVEPYKHVDKGDVIATVRVEPDRLALTRNETRLTRLRERMADYKEKNKDNEKEDYYKEAVQNYEDQIKDVEDAIKEQKKDFATKQIVADKTGVIVALPNYEKESIIQREAWICVIADENCCYVEVEDKNQILQYGNAVEIEYSTYSMEGGGKEEKHSVSGTVVSMSKMGVSSALQTDMKEVLLQKEEIESILQGTASGGWWDRYRYTVKAKVRTMDNVVMVPRSAVYDYGGGKTYVYVKDENGNAKAQSFISGGFNESYYWVAQGLTEGMEICLK